MILPPIDLKDFKDWHQMTAHVITCDVHLAEVELLLLYLRDKGYKVEISKEIG